MPQFFDSLTHSLTLFPILKSVLILASCCLATVLLGVRVFYPSTLAPVAPRAHWNNFPSCTTENPKYLPVLLFGQSDVVALLCQVEIEQSGPRSSHFVAGRLGWG